MIDDDDTSTAFWSALAGIVWAVAMGLAAFVAASCVFFVASWVWLK